MATHTFKYELDGIKGEGKVNFDLDKNLTIDFETTTGETHQSTLEKIIKVFEALHGIHCENEKDLKTFKIEKI